MATPSPALDPCAVFIVLLDKTEAALPAPSAPTGGGAKGHALDVYA